MGEISRYCHLALPLGDDWSRIATPLATPVQDFAVIILHPLHLLIATYHNKRLFNG